MNRKNELKAVLAILKSPENEYNANSLSKVLGITSMGALKMLKRLESEGVLRQRKVSNINLYSINFSSPYAVDYAAFLLKDEAEHSSPFVKRWAAELRKVKNAEMTILFGSAVRSGPKAADIDALFVVKPGKLAALQEEVRRANALNDKKIHPVFQARADLAKNIHKGDPVILNALKGIVVSGENEFVDIIGGGP